MSIIMSGMQHFKMQITRVAAVTLVLSCVVKIVTAQENWELKKDSDGIKIYAKCVANSNMKALKADFTVQGTPEQLGALLLNIPVYTEWVYNTKTSKLLKRVSDNEIIYYSEKSMPWPVSNRDAVMRIKVDKDPNTKVVKALVYTLDNYIPEKKNIVRVPQSRITWLITPIDAKTSRIAYEAQMDPGGSVPAWLVNVCASKGSFETFRDLQDKMEELY